MSWQVVFQSSSGLAAKIQTHASKNTFAHPLVFPLYFAGVSAISLALHVLFTSRSFKSFYHRVFRPATHPFLPTDDNEQPLTTNATPPTHTGFWSDAKAHITACGGPIIFTFKLARFIGCLGLVGTTVAVFILTEQHSSNAWHLLEEVLDLDELKGHGKKHKKKHRRGGSEWFNQAEWIQLALCAFYTYASMLALLTLTLRPRLRKLITKHLYTLLLATFAIYAYRDLWPLCTFTLHPLDMDPAWFTWSSIALLGFSGIVVPLFIPQEYVPLNPNAPKQETPEQTASYISFIFFTFLDPIVFKAWRMPHLPYEELPPLPDYDYADYLKKRSFGEIDPMQRKNVEGAKKDRHLFWGLMTVFRHEYMLLCFFMVLQVLFTFASPLGINRLLSYIENINDPTYNPLVRPWVWILWLFLGPFLRSVCMQLYIWITTGSLVRAEGILTQLIFEHSLRIRMKDDVAPGPDSSKSQTPKTDTNAQTPDSASISERVRDVREASEDIDGVTVVSGSNGERTNTAVGSNQAKKDEPAVAPTSPPADSSESKQSNLVGKINNLVSTDLGNVTEGRDFLFVILYAPLQVTLAIWFLWNILGWSAVVGMGFLVLTFPIPGKVAQLINNVQQERMKKTDARIQTVTETMNVLRMVKLFAWENKVIDQIEEKRDQELTWLRKRYWLGLLNMNLNYVLPLLTMIVTFSTYTLVMKKELTASRVFSSMTVFDMLRDQLHMVFWQVPSVIQGKVSLDRMDDFLRNTELIDSYAESSKDTLALSIANANVDPNAIGFHNTSFTWATQREGTPTPGRRNFTLRIEGDLFFQKGKINLVVGPTGSGKTSLLMALLGEMHFHQSGLDSWFNLPREEGVAYCAQEAWVQNETIKNNILFGQAYDEERYKKVIYQCGLERDLTLFDAGDQTEVGEKGLTLSGGQKARVTLARAIYSNAKILILDDVLSALDVHTSKWIIDKCFAGDLVQGRTLILVTHNVAMASTIADWVISLRLDGRVANQGPIAEALKQDSVLLAEVSKDKRALEVQEEVTAVEGEVKPDKPSGKLMSAEEIAEGHVGWPALRMYFTNLGGPIFWVLVVLGMGLADLANITQTWFLGFWAKQYVLHRSEEVYVPWYLTVYAIILGSGMVVYTSSYIIYVFGAIRASKQIHHLLAESVLNSTLRWLDSTPIGRIISRFTQDIRNIDGPIANMLLDLVELTLSMLLRFFAVIAFSPIFSIPGAFVAAVGGWCGQVYIAAQLCVKREMSNARSPLYSHFGAAISGITSIRAYGAEQAFITESLNRVNKYTRPARTFYNLNRWVCVRVDGLGAAFSAFLAAYLIYIAKVDASSTGFQLNMALGFSGMILWWVRVLNEFEVQGNSLERIQDYVTIEHEPPSTKRGEPPAYWPSSGNIRVDKLRARYSVDGPDVLHDVSFEIKSGERVGVVGRTGSGKSSLTLSLLRMIPTTGTVYYDGVATNTLNLSALRSAITIIPQQPELLSGTLRQNLDPFDEHDDAELNDALRAAGLYNVQSESEEGRITLDSSVSSGGSNFSVGQRQIVALARALVRNSKVLILDEATAAIDYETDTLIQNSIRTELKDVTLITVAHRLQTIMDADKILVLDAGRVIEFDSPWALLQKDGGALKALVDDSGDADKLYSMAQGAAGSSGESK